MTHLTCEKQFRDENINLGNIRYVRPMLFFFEQYVRNVRMLLFIVHSFVRSELTESYFVLLLRVELFVYPKNIHTYMVGGVLS